MPLTPFEVAELQAGQSRYGCGAYDCETCTPIVYACEFCGETYPAPIALKETYTCPNCEWVTNGSETY